MRVTGVSLRATEAATEAGRPALTPELLAATGARYSRNNEGLDAILARIDPENLDRSVDSIFRMIDYGHQSIADMAPVAMFLDGISIWLAYHVWSLCPTAGGQESSTRYVRFSDTALIPGADLGIPDELVSEWNDEMARCFDTATTALRQWEELAAIEPERVRIPEALLNDKSERAVRQVARMRRNYGFDRARYILPVATSTNMMLIMSARGWVQLCQQLLSHSLPEPRKLGEAICAELGLYVPRLLKHACYKDYFAEGIAQEFETSRKAATQSNCPELDADAAHTDARPQAHLNIMPPTESRGFADSHNFADDLSHHPNRYAWIGPGLRRTSVQFSWSAVAFAEIRDLNRHRTGTRYCPMAPVGYYSALDEAPSQTRPSKVNPRHPEITAVLHKLREPGRRLSARALDLLRAGDPHYVYWTVLGTQYAFEHTTTADKFLYEAELRTGTGAHYRYARHLRDALSLWYEQYPKTRGLVLEGSAEPE